MKRFKLRPFLEKDKPQYFWVIIFDTKKDLLKRLKYEGLEDEECEAICRSFDKYSFQDGKEKLTNHIGNIYFHKDFLGAGIVAHELLHAGIRYYKEVLGYYFEKLDCPLDDGDVQDEEEELCFTVQRLTREFWDKYYK